MPPYEEYWRGKGEEIAKDFPSFLISLVSLLCPSPSPELQPCTINVSVTVVTDCPQDITCLLPLQEKLRLLGEHSYWSRHNSKVLPRTVKATVSWLDIGFHIKENEILMVAWSKININEFIGYERSHESRCWVGGNGGKCSEQKIRKEQNKNVWMTQSWQNSCRRAAELVYLE